MVMQFKKTPEVEAAIRHYPRLKDRYFTRKIIGAVGPSLERRLKESEKMYAIQPDIKQKSIEPNSYSKNFESKIYKLGADMENTLVELEDINEEVTKSKKLLSETLDEISTIRALVGPELNKYVQEIRSNRMAVEREAKATLAEMKEIRKFFTDPKIAEDINKMNEFVQAIYSLKALSDNDMLNAMVGTLTGLRATKD